MRRVIRQMIGLVVWGLLPLVRAESDVQTIRVGFFQMAPLNFTSETGRTEGLNLDLLREIAANQHRWEPIFIPMTRAEALEQLQGEEIDLVMSVTKTLDRTKIMDYSDEPVLEVWGQIYVRRGSDIESVFDLKRGRIGVMRADVYGENFIQLVDAYGINYDLVAYESHREIFAAIAAEDVIAGVVPSYFGLRQGSHYGLLGTPIRFSPMSVYFAAKKGLHAEVLAEIDAQMGLWKKDENSYFHTRVSYWFGGRSSWIPSVPIWVKVVLGLAGVIPLLLFVLRGRLKPAVTRRAAEAAVLRAQQQLQHIVDSTNDVIFQLDDQGNYTYTNAAIEAITGYSESEILGTNVLQLIKPEYHEMIRKRFRKRPAGGRVPETICFEITRKDGESRWMELVSRGFRNEAGQLESVHGVARDVTKRFEMETELGQSRQFLRTILDMIPVGVFWKDLDLNYLGANRTFLDALGFKDAADIMGKDYKFVVQDEGIAKECRAVELEVLRSGGSSLNGEHILRTKTGETRTLLISRVPLVNVDGDIMGVLGAFVDVSERKAAEEKLAESKTFLRSIIDTIPSRVFWKDTDLNYQGCNVAFAKDAGVDGPQDVVGKSDHDLNWSADEASFYRKDDAEVMATGLERLNIEELQPRSGGNACWVSTSKVPMRDHEGKVIGVLGAYQDISDRKGLEEEYIRLSAAINQSAEAIVIADLNGIIQYVNPAFETVTGFEREEAVGANLSILKSNRYAKLFYDGLWKTVRSGESWSGRIINRHKNGTYYTAEVAFAPVKDGEGNIMNYAVGLRDVSPQVELEEQMRQAQKMEAVGRLAGGVAHDFNNILQSILGFSSILLGDMKKGTSQYDDVAEIRTAARRAGDLTRQLLTLSRKHCVEYAVLDLNDVVRRNEKMMRRLIGEHIRFVFDLAVDVRPVRADLSQIEQIILNLFINARDAMPDGGRLLVKTYNVVAESNKREERGRLGPTQVCLEVRDTGCGIRDDVREHLFEPFFTTKRMGEGTGLGLSVVYGIVQQHGGHIEVESKVGEGAIFRIYLQGGDWNDVKNLEEERPKESDRSLEGHGEAVLVVEDDVVLRDLMQRMLGDAGYSVVAVGSVEEARAELERTPVELLLSDIILPDGNGLELACKAREAGPLAVLLCSGYSHGPEVHETIQMNGFRYLEKPVGSLQMLQSVREMLDESRSV
ncbi:MAG: PAS domain S-box protein [Pontiella sp.]